MIATVLNANGFWECLKWSIIAGMWGVMAFGIYRENSILKIIERHPPSQTQIIALLRSLHQRHVQMGLLLCFLIIIEAADAFHAQSPPPVSPLPAEQAQPPVTALQPAPDIVSFEKSSAAAGAPQAIPFGDITEFNEKDSQEKAYLDWLKERYEAWIITYYYLQKCGQTDARDLALIENTLAQKLAAAHADPGVQSNILLAAKGSYDEMYNTVACDTAHLSASKATYDENMKQLKEVKNSSMNPVISTTPAR